MKWRIFMGERLEKLKAMLKKEQERRIKLNNRIAIQQSLYALFI